MLLINFSAIKVANQVHSKYFVPRKHLSKQLQAITQSFIRILH